MGKLTEDLIQWVQWAKKKADWFDPLISEPDEWLAGVDPNSLFAQDNSNSLGSGYQGFNQEPIRKSSWPFLPWYLKNK